MIKTSAIHLPDTVTDRMPSIVGAGASFLLPVQAVRAISTAKRPSTVEVTRESMCRPDLRTAAIFPVRRSRAAGQRIDCGGDLGRERFLEVDEGDRGAFDDVMQPGGRNSILVTGHPGGDARGVGDVGLAGLVDLAAVPHSKVMAFYRLHARTAAAPYPHRGRRAMFWEAIRDDVCTNLDSGALPIPDAAWRSPRPSRSAGSRP